MRFILNDLRKNCIYSHLTVASAFGQYCSRHQWRPLNIESNLMVLDWSL